MSAHDLARRVWADDGSAGTAALSAALLPASALFRLGARVYHGLYDAGVRSAARAPIPVISVGNLRIGGAGKTPFTRWVVEQLVALGKRPAVLHGGYGSDEPALHRRWRPDVPVVVGRERIDGVRAAVELGCDVAVLDDGFQHRRLARDLDVVLLAAEHGADRVRLLPRGPWREPLEALRRAGVVVVTRKTAGEAEANEVGARVRDVFERRPVRAWIRPDGWSGLDGGAAGAPAGPVVAVAATAEPESFFRTVESLGLDVVERVAFRDHHEYDASDIRRLDALAARGAIVTTEKDAVKLASLTPPWAGSARVLGQRVVIEEGGE
ncbi:MAG TPA: tetraacyldisaccharide 4'-kinase, partial [Longimicrobiales bacterium]